MTTIVQVICVLALFAGSHLGPTTLPHVPGPAVVLPGEVEFKAAHVRIRYPADFVDGRYEPVAGDEYRLFADALVLVEVSRAPHFDRARLPVGNESLPVISIHALDAAFTKTVFMPLIKPTWRTMIGGREVFKFPGYPGPGGEAAHCYLVPREKGTSLLLIASREFRMDGASSPTHYDWVIERIIADLRVGD